MAITGHTIFAQAITVWPGDANNDGIVNNTDVLYVGNGFSSQGNARNTIQIDWVPTTAIAWQSVLPNSLNMGYTDCSGNGFVSVEDVFVIESNYGETNSNFNGQNFLNGSLNDPHLQVMIADSFWLPGDTVDFEVVLFQAPTDSVYGIAFTLSIDSILASVENVILKAHPQFGGGGRQPVFVAQKFTGSGIIEFGISRTNQLNHGGAIAVASASMIIEDNLIGKSFLELAHAFQISNISMVDKLLQEKAVKGDSTQAKIITGLSEKLLQQKIQIYPIPAQNQIAIKLDPSLHIEELVAVALNGATYPLNFEAQSHFILEADISHLLGGLYILKVKTQQGILHQKIKIER